MTHNRKTVRLERRVAQLTGQLADEKAEHEATRRELKVAEAEIASMAAVIARDRERIKAESAAYARQRAEYEGVKSGRDN